MRFLDQKLAAMRKSFCLLGFFILLLHVEGYSNNPLEDSTRKKPTTKKIKTTSLKQSIVSTAVDESVWWRRGSTLRETDEEVLQRLKRILRERKTTKFLLGQSRKKRKIKAWYFPGTSEGKALVIGGMHGSELSAIEVAERLVQNLLGGEENYYNVIIIPCLFPDNAATARKRTLEIGSTANIGRYSFSTAPDPNRQMPGPGEAFDERSPRDHVGREIEKENQLLLHLIRLFKPDRIANIHAIRDVSYAGIFADPRTDSRGFALGFTTDSSLAVEMALLIHRQDGYVPGNELNKIPTAGYYKDPAPVAKGNFQERNFSGSPLPFNRGSGITLGTWGSTAIGEAKDPSMNREAIRVITVEFPGYKRSDDYKNEEQKNYFRRQIDLYASSIGRIFLGKYFIEEAKKDQPENSRVNSDQQRE